MPRGPRLLSSRIDTFQLTATKTAEQPFCHDREREAAGLVGNGQIVIAICEV